MNPAFISRQWRTLCESAKMNSLRLAEGLSAPAAALLRGESDRFGSAAPPHDKPSLEAAYTRRMALSTRLTAISRADALARENAETAEAILICVAQFCEPPLPDSSDAFLEMQLRNVELTRAIAEACEAVGVA